LMAHSVSMQFKYYRKKYRYINENIDIISDGYNILLRDPGRPKGITKNKNPNNISINSV
jgi:hypothetical protein